MDTTSSQSGRPRGDPLRLGLALGGERELRVRAEGLESTGGERYRQPVAAEVAGIGAGSFLVPRGGDIDGVVLSTAGWLDGITSTRVASGQWGEAKAMVLEVAPAGDVPDYL